MHIDQLVRQIVKPGFFYAPPHISTEWPVVAVDQFRSSNHPYWKTIADRISGIPSTGHLVLPEILLNGNQAIDHKVQEIIRTQYQYLANGTIVPVSDGPEFILMAREFDGRTTYRLLCTLDLEQYSLTDKNALIKPTEQTFGNKTKVRYLIRKDAPLELPHILEFLYDPRHQFFDDLIKQAKTPFVNVDLMNNAGNIKAYHIEDYEPIYSYLGGLLREHQNSFIFSGDGNTSMAAAKQHWEEVKQKMINDGENWQDHPARYAAAELIGMFDPAIQFDPIHRIVYDLPDSFLQDISQNGVTYTASRNVNLHLATANGTLHHVGIVTPSIQGILNMPPFTSNPLATLNEILAPYNPTIEFEHCPEQVMCDVAKTRGIGFLLPPVSMNTLADILQKDGITPAKYFAMIFGRGKDPSLSKNHYLFSRLIVPSIHVSAVVP